MKKRVIFVGKSAAGKDHARKICEQWLGLQYQVSYTTRPAREFESDGVDYFFIPMREFNKMLNQDMWYEHVSFNGWQYGTTREQMQKPDSCFIMTPHGLSMLTPEDRAESHVILLDMGEEIRRERISERRQTSDSIERRMIADEHDFKDFTDFDISLTNHRFHIMDIWNLVAAGMDFPERYKKRWMDSICTQNK